MEDEIKITLRKEKRKGAVLKVIGVGGAGGNAVNRMIAENLRGVEFIAINTDSQDLEGIRKGAATVQIGEKITRGLGTGSNPEIGEQAALESTDTIIEMLEGANMAFITAGMGGGTGTGASPVIANHASSMGILTVAVVTKPFHFEREKRMHVAEEGIRKLKECVDAIIVIPNQKLLEMGDLNISFKDAYQKADEVLHQAVQGISAIISSSGYQNVDFADVKTAMVGKGWTLMGTGDARGENRGEEAARKALNSPLLDNLSIHGATGILYNITAGTNLTLAEIDRISQLITGNADPDALIKFGVIEDEALGDTLRVTVIATGFKENQRPLQSVKAKTPSGQPLAVGEPFFRRPTPQKILTPSKGASAGLDLVGYVSDSGIPSMSHGPDAFEDPLDIPTFLRQSGAKKR